MIPGPISQRINPDSGIILDVQFLNFLSLIPMLFLIHSGIIFWFIKSILIEFEKNWNALEATKELEDQLKLMRDSAKEVQANHACVCCDWRSNDRFFLYPSTFSQIEVDTITNVLGHKRDPCPLLCLPAIRLHPPSSRTVIRTAPPFPPRQRQMTSPFPFRCYFAWKSQARRHTVVQLSSSIWGVSGSEDSQAWSHRIDRPASQRSIQRRWQVLGTAHCFIFNS